MGDARPGERKVVKDFGPVEPRHPNGAGAAA